MRSLDLDGTAVLVSQGRAHLYEGHSGADVAHGVRTAWFAGCRIALLTNAAGSLRAEVGPGTGVLLTDFFQFGMAMLGSVWATFVIVGLPEVGGMEALLRHENVAPKLDILPDFSDWDLLVPLFILPLAVQWWSVWYPGSEPGGGGYIAQRMLAARSERQAMKATLFFNVAHYAIRPWPWIVIALASIVVFPDIASLQAAFPAIDAGIVQNDLAYFAMLTYLPSGLLGLVVASLIAAFMSTISTHLNWGSSYVVNDFYQRFVKPEASEADLVRAGADKGSATAEFDLDDDTGVDEPERVRVDRGVAFLLPAVGVEALSEVALGVEQADPDQRDTEVGRRLEMVAGEHAETTRVLGERFGDPELRGEVGHAAQRRAVTRPAVVEPRLA